MKRDLLGNLYCRGKGAQFWIKFLPSNRVSPKIGYVFPLEKNLLHICHLKKWTRHFVAIMTECCPMAKFATFGHTQRGAHWPRTTSTTSTTGPMRSVSSQHSITKNKLKKHVLLKYN